MESRSRAMNTFTRTILLCLATASIAAAAPPENKKLTPQRLAELISPDGVPKYAAYRVTISGLGHPFKIGGIAMPKPHRPQPEAPASIHFKAGNESVTLEHIRELRFPTEFDT